ncbi:hypothetical protein HY634_03145 [Candidatus Uhrbacteria bacterium]|nr:hypothetical protein [Candidatus Uhrbacteria bacterium]
MPNAPSTFTEALLERDSPHLAHVMETLGGRIPIFGSIEQVTGLFEGGCHDWQDRRLTQVTCVLPDDTVYSEPRAGLSRASVVSEADKLAARLHLEPHRVSIACSESHPQLDDGISRTAEWALATIAHDDWSRLQAEGHGLTIVASNTCADGMFGPSTISRRVFPRHRYIAPGHVDLNPFSQPLVIAAYRAARVEYRMQSGVVVYDERRDCLNDLKWILRLKSGDAAHRPRCAVDDHRALAQDVLDTLLGAKDVAPDVTRLLLNRALITLFGTPRIAGLPATERSGLSHSVLSHETVYDDVDFGDPNNHQNGSRVLKGYHLPVEDLLNPKYIIVRDAPTET